MRRRSRRGSRIKRAYKAGLRRGRRSRGPMKIGYRM